MGTANLVKYSYSHKCKSHFYVFYKNIKNMFLCILFLYVFYFFVMCFFYFLVFFCAFQCHVFLFFLNR